MPDEHWEGDMRIIIAEDEPRARKGLEKQIQALGEEYQVVGTAADGSKALELIRSLHPDVVFTDIRMPYIDDGIKLIKACREERIPTEFVIVSAYEEFDYAQQACNMGVAGYLVKPIEPQELVRTLERLKGKLLAMSKAGYDQDDLEHTGTVALHDRYPGVNSMVRKVLDYMEENYGQRFSQTDVAAELGITPQYLSTVFKQETGEGFVKVLQTYRIEVARHLMDAGNTDTEDVADKVGIEPKYFAKLFKENTGMSVREYLNR